jgi:hypothetical protein
MCHASRAFGPLARYDLPDPTTDPARLRAAFVEHSAGMLTRMPVRVAAPLLGHIYRSALGPNPWVLALIGSPGSYKTSLASLDLRAGAGDVYCDPRASSTRAVW